MGGVTRWVSGETNDKGVIGVRRGAQFIPLVTESFDLKKNPQQQYQQHHEVINSEQQVQIYEELVKDSNGNFTTSFLSLADTVYGPPTRTFRNRKRPAGLVVVSSRSPVGS